MSAPAGKVIPLPPNVSTARRAKRAHQAARKGAISKLDARVAQLERLFATLDQRITHGKFNRRFQISLTASILLHLVVIAFVTFSLPKKSGDLGQPMEVVLVNAKSAAKPVKADVKAQNNLDGGGNTDADRRAKSPLPVLRDDGQASEVALAKKSVEQLEQEVRRLMTQAQSKSSVASAQQQTAPQVQASAQPPNPSISDADVQRSLQIQRLEAAIAKQWDAYQKRPRKQFVGARAEEYRFARYVEDWRVKIERIGELNYPPAARDQKIYGSLLLSVSIKSDGNIEKVELIRSSGHKVLDEAAIRIVKLSAPYARFPPDIAKDTDIIDITRTWRFTNTDRLQTE